MYSNDKRPMSARERRPASSGRNNLNSCSNNSTPRTIRSSSTQPFSSRPSTSRHTRSSDEQHVKLLNDPLYVNRQYYASKVFDDDDDGVRIKPVLPPSRHPLIPRDSSTPRLYKKPSICPDGWVARNQQPSWLETADFRTLLDEDEKSKIARKFIERNRYNLVEFDHSYRGKSCGEVCEIMTSHPNFLHLMRQYTSKERKLRLGTSSRQIRSVLSHEHLQPVHLPAEDPFMITINTTREARDEKISRLFRPTLQRQKSEHIRGYAHAPEYGNFSNLCGVLKKGSSLNR